MSRYGESDINWQLEGKGATSQIICGVEVDVTKLIRKVAERTMRWNFRMWGFGEAVALRGLLKASRTTGDAEALGYVKGLLRAYAGRGVARSSEEHVAPGSELLLLYEETGEDILLEAAKRLADMHRSFPVNAHGARLHRCDLARLAPPDLGRLHGRRSAVRG